jgi:TP901 family phage tail tape measure protein
MPIQVPVVQTGLEQSIQQAAAKAGKNLRINMGPGAKSIESLSKPLGRLTGKADEFTKSMEAANARVLAFGASVGVIAAVSKGLQELVKTTIEVEKSLANINSILGQTESQLDSFKNQIFDIARNTGQTFDTVAEAALELSRQGLKAEEVTKRLNDALVLSRLSGLSAADSVAGLTAAVNSFSSAGLTTTEVLNKISAAAASAAVSDRDLIEGLKRSGAVAVASGVQFDELIGIISALQERTARGGAVIGNSLKTIFTRIQDIEKLQSLQDLGVQVTDLEGRVLSSNKIIENLAPTFAKLDQASKVNLADNLVGKFQIAPFLALLEDYNLKVSRSGEVAATSFNATNEAYQRNEALSKTLADAVNVATVNLKELANTLGEIGVTDSLKDIIGVFNSIVSSIRDVLDGDGIGSQFAKGLIKGISAVIAGPGLALALVAIGKLLLDFAKFGAGALKTFFGLNSAAQKQATLQGQIAASLLNDKGIRSSILSIEKQNISEGEKKKLQTQFFTKALNDQLMVMQKMQGIARTIAPGVMAGTASRRGTRAAGGFLPIGAESSDISRGVGGAPSSAKPVVIPNFAFGGGKRGTMVANDSEYIVPNYANGGDAIFNQNMASSMGLPTNARKVRAASGYIPNYVDYTIGGRRFSGAGVAAALRAGTITPQQAAAAGYKTSAQKKAEDGKKTTKTTLNIPARMFGVASLFKGKKTADSSTAPNQLSSPLAQQLAGSGVKNIKFTGIQIKSLEDFKRNAKVTEKSNRTDLAKRFASPLVGYAQNIIGKTFGNDEKAAITKEIERLGGSGGTGGARLFSASVEGGILESAMTLATKGAKGIKDFTSNSEDQIPFDFEENGLATSQFKKTFGFTNKLQKADAKRTASNEAVRTVIKKAFNDKASQRYIRRIANSQGFKTKRASGGYIPNFAEGALEEAIGREKAAGLPVNQIRINQSGKLRNAQNPQGLAVTNTRDEPTGAIPAARGFIPNYFNFGATNVNKLPSSGYTPPTPTASPPTAPGPQKDLTGIFFAVTAGMTALQGATSGAESGLGKFTNMLSGSLQTVTGFAFAGAGISSAFQGATSGIGKFASKLGPAGLAIGGIMGAFQLGKSLYLEYSGANQRASLALAKLKDASNDLSFAFNQLSEVEKVKTQKRAEEILSRSGPSEDAVTVIDFENLFEGFSDMTVEEAKETNKQFVERGEKAPYIIDGDKVREFEARTFETDSIEEGFKNTISQLKAAGVSFEEIDDILDGYKSFLDSKELGEFSDIAVRENKRLRKAQKEFSGFLSGLSSKDLKRAMEAKSMQDAGLEGLNDIKDFGRINPKVIQDLLDKEEGERKRQQDAERKDIEQINFRSVQNQVKTKLEIFKIEQKSRSEAEKELLIGEKLNTISLERKQELQNIIAGEQEIEALNSKVADGLVEQISNIKGITSEKLKSLQLDQKIEASLKDGKLTQKDALDILKQTADTLAAGGQNIGAQEAALKQYLTDLYKRAEAEKGVNKTIREGEQSLERSARLARDIKLGRDISAQRDLGKTRRSGESEIAGIDQRIAEINMGASGKSIKSQRAGALQIAQLEFERTQIANKSRIDQALRSAEKARQEAAEIEESDPVAAKKLRSDARRARLDASNQNRIDLQNAQSRLDTARSLVHFKDAITLATDAVTNLSPELEQLEMIEKTAGTARERQEARLRRRAIESSIEQGGTPDEILKRINQEPLTRSLRDRFSLLQKDDLEISSHLKDNLVQASDQFAHNIGNAMLEAIESGEDLGGILLGTASEFLKTISRAFMKSAVDDVLGSFGVGLQGGGPIRGGSGTKDDVPAVLMGGEFVMNKKAVKKYGMGFMSALNNGSLQGFASGGQVKDREGMFTTPGMNGAGAIKGAENLLSFATQTPVAMNRDTITSSGAFLDAESGRMTMFGRRNNPQFQKVQDAKRQAFDLYASEMAAEQQAIEQEKANKEALMDSLKSAAISAVASVGIKSMAAGFKAGFSGTEGSFGAKLGAGLKGTIFGGNDIAGQSYGGLSNLFTGRGLQSGPSGLGSGFTPKSASARPQATPFTPKSVSAISSDYSGPIEHKDAFGNDALDGLTAEDRGVYDTNISKRGVLPVLKATGGLIPAAGGVDTVPAMLSGGEFVMNAAATRNIGSDNLQALNSGAGVGDNADLIAKLEELILATEASQSTGEINITVNGSNGTDTQTSGQDTTDQQRQLSERIKVAVKQVIADEQRLGGQLRR